MKILVNLKKIASLNLSVEEYIIIYGICTNNLLEVISHVKLTSSLLTSLEEKGAISIKNLKTLTFQTSDENVEKCKKLITVEELNWIEEWINLWPEGIKSGGYYVRSSKAAILQNMKKFMDQHDYTDRTIIHATTNYLEEMRHKGYSGIQLAHNFIEKNKNSSLEVYCRQFTRLDHESRLTAEEPGLSI